MSNPTKFNKWLFLNPANHWKTPDLRKTDGSSFMKKKVRNLEG